MIKRENLSVVEEAEAKAEGTFDVCVPKWSVYSDRENGPQWLGSFPSKKIAESFAWSHKHATELLYALKHARAIIEGEMDSGSEFEESEIDYIDGVIDMATIEREAIS